MLLGLLDPDPDPLVRGTDLDPSVMKHKPAQYIAFLEKVHISLKLIQLWIRTGNPWTRIRQNDVDPTESGSSTLIFLYYM